MGKKWCVYADPTSCYDLWCFGGTRHFELIYESKFESMANITKYLWEFSHADGEAFVVHGKLSAYALWSRNHR